MAFMLFASILSLNQIHKMWNCGFEWFCDASKFAWTSQIISCHYQFWIACAHTLHVRFTKSKIKYAWSAHRTPNTLRWASHISTQRLNGIKSQIDVQRIKYFIYRHGQTVRNWWCWSAIEIFLLTIMWLFYGINKVLPFHKLNSTAHDTAVPAHIYGVWFPNCAERFRVYCAKYIYI